MIFMLFGFSFLRYGSDLPGVGRKDVRRVGRVKFSPVFFERPGRSPTDSARERLGDRKDETTGGFGKQTLFRPVEAERNPKVA
jgi:hypothetical protein